MLIGNTGIQFVYDPEEARASTRQVTLLLQGLGYDQATCVHDKANGVVVVVGQKFGDESLDQNEYEVAAIWNVLGQWIDIAYYKLRAVEQLTYTGDGDVEFKKL